SLARRSRDGPQHTHRDARRRHAPPHYRDDQQRYRTDPSGLIYGAGDYSANPERIVRPSVPPIAGRVARSGWGIMTAVVSSSPRIPATAPVEPLGFESGVMFPSASQ